jgi:hypothetical protein
MVKADLYQLIGPDNVFSSMKEAIGRANELLNTQAEQKEAAAV